VQGILSNTSNELDKRLQVFQDRLNFVIILTLPTYRATKKAIFYSSANKRYNKSNHDLQVHFNNFGEVYLV